jgi:hypothetical protein
MMAPKRVLAISDLHCGHTVGLTPISKWRSKSTDEGKLDRAMWNAFEKSIDGYKGCDVLLVVGDAIDGQGKKSGGREQITTDPLEQCDYAVEVLKYIKPKKVAMVAGTGYHTGDDTDYESVIAKELGAEFGGALWVEVNGVVFNLRHFVGSSVLPHTRHTAIARERMLAHLWEERGTIPNAHVYLRGHVHYHVYSGGAGWLAMTLPALQGLGSIFGVRKCSGLVDFGVVGFEVDKGKYKWDARTIAIKEQESKLISL